MWPASFLECLVLTLVVLVVLVKLFSVLTVGRCKSTPDMSGKTVVITGANTGIGKETAKELCRRNARVIMACRDLDNAHLAADEIAWETGLRPGCMPLDLCSFKSIKQFAQKIVDREQRLDVLINNAGGMAPPQITETEDGFEETFQSNYLGHFLLTNLLLGLLKKSAPSRVINVGSLAHWIRALDDDISFKRYSRNQVYASAKLFCMLFTMELARRIAGSGVTVNCCHPGIVKSRFADRYDDLYTRLINFIIHIFEKSVEDEAQTSVHLSVSEGVEGVSGQMFVDCKPVKAPGKPEDARALWEISQRMTGFS
ncbi:retinol dehydrogenase 13-like [Amblyomma americanum]